MAELAFRVENTISLNTGLGSTSLMGINSTGNIINVVNPISPSIDQIVNASSIVGTNNFLRRKSFEYASISNSSQYYLPQDSHYNKIVNVDTSSGSITQTLLTFGSKYAGWHCWVRKVSADTKPVRFTFSGSGINYIFPHKTDPNQPTSEELVTMSTQYSMAYVEFLSSDLVVISGGEFSL